MCFSIRKPLRSIPPPIPLDVVHGSIIGDTPESQISAGPTCGMRGYCNSLVSSITSEFIFC